MQMYLVVLEKSANSLSETAVPQKLDTAIYCSWLGIKSVTQCSKSIAEIQRGGQKIGVPLWIDSPCLKNIPFLYFHLKKKKIGLEILPKATDKHF